MEFYEVLRRRRSVRSFLREGVEPGKLSSIIGALMRAPSAGNLQSYKVYVVRSAGAREALVPALDYQESAAAAPVLLVFCADPRRSETKYGQRGFELFAAQDATIAAAYCQLAAAAEGLGSVWIGDFDPLEVSRVLSVLSYEVPVAVVAIGHPAEEPPESPRRDPGEMVREV
jgi:nitroreductase